MGIISSKCDLFMSHNHEVWPGGQLIQIGMPLFEIQSKKSPQ